MNLLKRMYRAMRMELREHKSSFIAYTFFRISAILVTIYQFINQNYESFFLGLLTLILLMVPSLLQITLRMEFPTVLEITILFSIFAAEILGEINEFYIMIPWWDTFLHTLNGFLAAAIGFSMVNLLNQSDKLVFSLSPLFSAVVAFCFSMTIGVVWEIFEFAMDQLFLLDMQKDTVVQTISSVVLDPEGGNKPFIIREIQDVAVSGNCLNLGGYLDIGIIDTMHDLIVNFIGALAFSVIGFFYVKRQGNNQIAHNLIPRRKETEKDYLKTSIE